MALMLVLPAVALATVLAYAVLASTGVQEQIGANAASIAQADALAESGVNYAMYNLQYPSNAPTFTGGFWAGPSGNVSLGTAVPGMFNVSVAQQSTNYLISSTGTITAPGGTVISRTVYALVQIAYQAVQPNQAGGFNGPLNPTGGAIINTPNDIRANGAVSVSAGSTFGGTIYAPSVVNHGGTVNAFVQTPSAGAAPAPTAVTDYRTYTYNGVTYSGTLLTTDPVAGTVLGPTANNPAGVYYRQGTSNMNLNGITINGTLIVKKSGANGGGVNIAGSSANTITPKGGFPGLVVDTQIVMAGNNRQLTVNGIAWAGTGLSRSGTTNTGSVLTVNGSLLIPSSNGLGSFSGTLNLNYNVQNVNVPNFSSQTQVPKSIGVLSWNEQ